MMVRLGMVSAHETEHVFTGYLLKNPEEHTPPEITYGGFGDALWGESGRFLEGGVFGGTVDMKLSLKDNMEKIAVTTYAQCHVLDQSQIEAIIQRSESPFPPTSDSTSETGALSVSPPMLPPPPFHQQLICYYHDMSQ